MTKEELISCLQADLKRERLHFAFYMQSSVNVKGFFREEMKEFLLNQAKDEFNHIHQFSEFLVHLGAVPEIIVDSFPNNLCSVHEILSYAKQMEQEVANIYASRLRGTHEMEDATEAYAHVFYEDQIRDSQKTAWELEKMIGLHAN